MRNNIPETLEEARTHEEERIPQPPPGNSTLPEQQWLHDIFLPRKLTKAPMLFSTGITCILITDKGHPVNDARKAHWLTEIAKRDATYVMAFSWEFPESYEFPEELDLPFLKKG